MPPLSPRRSWSGRTTRTWPIKTPQLASGALGAPPGPVQLLAQLPAWLQTRCSVPSALCRPAQTRPRPNPSSFLRRGGCNLAGGGEGARGATLHVRSGRCTAKYPVCPGLCPLRCPAMGAFTWLVCHPGLNCTLHPLRQRFWWPSMVCDARSFIAACAREKSSHQPSVGLLKPLPIPRHPWSHIAVNFVTCLPCLPSLILTIVDRLSKALCHCPSSPQQRRPGTS